MRVSRPASWFLQAAKESSTRSTPVSRRYLHATCRCQQDANRNDPNNAEAGHETRNEQLNPVQPKSDQDDTSISHDPKLKSSWWVPRHAKQALAERKQRATDVRKQLQEGVKQLRRYTPDEIKELRQLYTPQQIEALLAAEEAIDPEDVVTQGEVRTDPAGLAYLDDLASVDPVLDKLAQSPEIQYGSSLDGPSSEAGEETKAARTGRGGKETKELTAAQKRLRDADEDPHMLRLCQQTGYTMDQIKKFKTKDLVSRRVVNQTRMGKIMSNYSLVIAGNMNGLLGVGEGKSVEGADAVRQATTAAIRNMRPVHRYENRTIYGEVEGKVGAVKVKLMPRGPGFGCRTQHLIFEMCRAAGIKDLAARTSKSRNQMNVCKAAWQAMLSQKLPDEVALGRGKKMVDVRKVYFAGNV